MSSITHPVLVFSEEYVRVTKGMFVVWMGHVRATAAKHQVTVLLNQEHWAFEEACAAFENDPRVDVYRLPYAMPNVIIKRLFRVADRMWLLRAARFALGQALNFLLCPLVVMRLCWWLRQRRPHVVFSHTGGWPAGPLCRWIICAAALAGVPRRILIIHNYPMHPANPLVRVLSAPLRRARAWLIERCATTIVTVSDSVKASLEASVFRRPVERIHNGIALLPLPGQRQAAGGGALEWRPSGVAVGFVGALYPLKGPHVLLDAFRWVDAPCELALLGPSEPDYLRSLQERARLCANKVSFLGFHHDVDAFMERIDFLVVPSIAFESFGMVILEAMKHRKAVICTDFGGMKEVVADGLTGIVVSAGDVQALSSAISRLASDADLRTRMGEAGHRRLQERFTVETMASQYDALATG